MASDKPNIVFLLTDDQRFDTIAALGNEQILTPNMDKLVRSGTSFTHAHIPCGTSPAVCMPSRAMINTGRTLFHIDGAGQQIPTEHTTLGEAFRRGGYRAFGTGKWHNGPQSYCRSFDAGAEIFFGGMADHWNVPMYNLDPSGRYATTCPVCESFMSSNKIVQRPCDHIHAGRHSSEVISGAAVDFLRAYDRQDPLLMYVAFLAPHDPRTMPDRYRRMYDPDRIRLPENFMGGHPFDNGELHVRDEMLAAFPRTPEEVRRHLADYYAMITHLDDQIGHVMQTLTDTGRMDNTILVLAGDNGLALGQHGLFGKQSCYDHSVRVPLVFAGPGVPKGVRSDALVYLLDIFPTLCELGGIETPSSVEGVSLVPAMRGRQRQVRESLYFAYTDKHRAVRDRTHKLIEYVVNGRHSMTQLFNLSDDPWELHNLAGNPACAGRLGELRGLMKRHRDQWDDARSEWGRRFWQACNI